jgi:hypothetical protein
MKPLWISLFNGEICRIDIVKQKILIVGVSIKELLGEIFVFEKC